jgi:hypothetical protein
MVDHDFDAGSASPPSISVSEDGREALPSRVCFLEVSSILTRSLPEENLLVTTADAPQGTSAL